ncbi:MAG: hypothetical protein M1275_00570, partial [Patescibacteria group bacterium]|nr:hypothetical protein [Patescibacteria group bacterium]
MGRVALGLQIFRHSVFAGGIGAGDADEHKIRCLIFLLPPGRIPDVYFGDEGRKGSESAEPTLWATKPPDAPRLTCLR